MNDRPLVAVETGNGNGYRSIVLLDDRTGLRLTPEISQQLVERLRNLLMRQLLDLGLVPGDDLTREYSTERTAGAPASSNTTDGFRNADAACEMLVSGVKTRSAVPTSAIASRSRGVSTGSARTALATFLNALPFHRQTDDDDRHVRSAVAGGLKRRYELAIRPPPFRLGRGKIHKESLRDPSARQLRSCRRASVASFHFSSARARSSGDRNISGCQSTASGFTPNGTASCFRAFNVVFYPVPLRHRDVVNARLAVPSSPNPESRPSRRT